MKPAAYYSSTTKRAFDFLLALVLLVILSPLLFGIGLVIFLTSGLPVVFAQKRMGLKKKHFTIYKFRTMYLDARYHQKKYNQLNRAPRPMFKIFDDPRFVGIGRWLSRTGLDELPQLINIAKGEMSLVGPRPLPVKEAKGLSKTWDFRYQVKPGVFSEWTLSPDRHESLKTWKKLDQDTLKHGGLFYDLQLIWQILQKITFHS